MNNMIEFHMEDPVLTHFSDARPLNQEGQEYQFVRAVWRVVDVVQSFRRRTAQKQ